MQSIVRLLAFVCVVVVASGCARESADALFAKGEAAAHRESAFPDAERHLAAFLNGYPKDPRADTALHILARVQLSQGKYEDAVTRYAELVARFPQSRYADQAQFMVGFTLDQQGKLDEARAAYQKVIDQYPDSDLADDARVSIANLGKPPEAWFPAEPDASGP
jgi:outer membrane protein assembly factor BamD (BamD/ComL family)